MDMYKDLPRCNSRQTSGYLAMLAVRRTLMVIRDDIPERLDAVGAKDAVDGMIVRTTKMAEQLLMTYPETKQRSLWDQANYVIVKLETARDPNGSKGHTYIDTDTLGTVLEHAHESCRLCVKPERCNTCDLGKAFDKCCPEERGKRESWADIDITGD